MSNPFDNVPQLSKTQLNDGEGYNIPLPHIRLYVKKGQAWEFKTGGAALYGGFAINEEDVNTIVSLGIDPGDLGLERQVCKSKAGHEYVEYTVRNIYFATRSDRFAWFKGTKKDGSTYNFTRYNVLGIIGKETGGKIVPVAVAVLTGRGHSGTYLRDNGVNAFAKLTADARAELGTAGVPASFFWNVLGSGAGDERETVMVGKGAQSDITVIGTQDLPDVVTKEVMEARFIGDEGIELLQAITNDIETAWVLDWSKANIRAREAAKDAEASAEAATNEMPF